MKIWANGQYNPNQMMDACHVPVFDSYSQQENATTGLISLFAVHKDYHTLPSVVERHIGTFYVSVSRALGHLVSVAGHDAEYDFGRDGIDALAYSLNGRDIEKAIEVLKKVRDRQETPS